MAVNGDSHDHALPTRGEMPIIISPAAADDITRRKANPWFVRVTTSG